MTSRILIRPARPDDAPLAAVAFRLSMGEFADYLFGRDGRATEVALIRLFSRNAGRFGYDHASVIEQGGRGLGMVTAFPGAEAGRLSFAVTRYLSSVLGAQTFGFVARSLPFAFLREAEADEYFISNLAVLPATQRQGFGARLLAHADGQARARGFSKLSLLVHPSNEAAIKLYQKHGYGIVFTKHHKNPIASYHRMVKTLTANPPPSTDD